MKRDGKKKLVLHRESVRVLGDAEQRSVAGGLTADGCGTNGCETTLVIDCKRSAGWGLICRIIFGS